MKTLATIVAAHKSQLAQVELMKVDQAIETANMRTAGTVIDESWTFRFWLRELDRALQKQGFHA